MRKNHNNFLLRMRSFSVELLRTSYYTFSLYALYKKCVFVSIKNTTASRNFCELARFDCALPGGIKKCAPEAHFASFEVPDIWLNVYCIFYYKSRVCKFLNFQLYPAAFRKDIIFSLKLFCCDCSDEADAKENTLWKFQIIYGYRHKLGIG